MLAAAAPGPVVVIVLALNEPDTDPAGVYVCVCAVDDALTVDPVPEVAATLPAVPVNELLIVPVAVTA